MNKVKGVAKVILGLLVLGLGVLFLCFCSSGAVHQFIIDSLNGL